MVCGISFMWTENWYRFKKTTNIMWYVYQAYNFQSYVYYSCLQKLNIFSQWTKTLFWSKETNTAKSINIVVDLFWDLYIVQKIYVNCSRKMEQNQEMLFTSWLLMWVAVWRALNVNTWNYCIQYYIFYISRLCRGKLWAFYLFPWIL